MKEKAMAKWHVFDKWDCFNNFKTATEAAELAQQLADDGFEGVHMIYMDNATLEEYVKNGKWPNSGKMA